MGIFQAIATRGTAHARRALLSRWYPPLALLALFAALAVIGGALAGRLGYQLPALTATQHPVTLTGPGATATQRATVYVLGAVRTPGVYALDAGARVRDAVEAAGGALANADLTRVDLAAPLADGQSIYVPLVGEQLPSTIPAKVNINTATATQMHNALGVSLTIARRIVAYRSDHGAFTAVSQLLLVPVSKTTYDRIKDLVTV